MATTTLKDVRSAVNAFTGLVVAALATMGSLSPAATKGLRNLYRDAIRGGGTQHKGFYSLLPGAVSKDDGGAAATPIVDAILTQVRENVVANTKALIPLLVKAGKVQGTYNENDDNKVSQAHTVDIDCAKFKVPSDKVLASYMEQAFAGGGNVVIEGF